MPSTSDKKSPFVFLSGLAGIGAFVVAVAGSLVLGFLARDYDPLQQTISELGESGRARAMAAGIGFILVGALEIIFAAGLSFRSRPRKLALAGSIFLAVNGLFDYVGSGLFPCDPGGTYVSASGQIHFIVSVIGMSVMVLPAFFYWRVFRAEKRAPETAVTLAAAIGIAVFALLFNLGFFTGRYTGLFQRLLDFAYFAWILLLSLRMLVSEKDKR